jgi:hypothetical protein
MAPFPHWTFSVFPQVTGMIICVSVIVSGAAATLRVPDFSLSCSMCYSTLHIYAAGSVTRAAHRWQTMPRPGWCVPVPVLIL